MGVRVTYQEVPKMNLKNAITVDFADFKEWYESVGKEYPDDIDYDLLEIFETCNPETLFEEVEKTQIDEFVALYIGDFCDYGLGKLSAVKESTMLNISNYLADQVEINKICSAGVIQLWDYIIRGRSIIDNKPFNVYKSEYKYCAFSEEECQILQSELSNKFDLSEPDGFNTNPGIGSLVAAITMKKGNGLLVTVT